MKKGFISMAVVYTFLILFLLILFSILSSYLFRMNMVDVVTNKVKEELNDSSYLR